MNDRGEIVIYQTQDGLAKLDVILEGETVWITQDQMAELFDVHRQAITKHVKNIYESHELDEMSTSSILELVQKEGNRVVKRSVALYNLDLIISVGFRVNTQKGIEFRRWANQVLKEHLLKGYSVNQRLISQENKIENLDSRVVNLEKQVDFFVKTNLPPSEGVIPANARWSGYEFAVQLVRSAKKEIIIIDPFANDTSLSLVAKRAVGVNAIIYSARISRAMKDEVDHINRQFPTVELRTMREVHDRFIIVDETIYHVGASIMDLGCKMTAFSVLNLVTKEQLLALVK
jgi:hypothetical protein